MADALTDDPDWRWRARQRLMAWLPPEAVVEVSTTGQANGTARVLAAGRLGEVAIDWWADGETLDEALDELIRHVRRTPPEMLAGAYRSARPELPRTLEPASLPLTIE